MTHPGASPGWDLFEALAAVCDSPSAGTAVGKALGFGPMSSEDHTRVFVMNLPPHASIYLGPEGQLGGEAADRVAGFWRAIGVPPSADPDHLASLLALYAHLGAAGDEPGIHPATRQAITRRRHALLWEHLWPWVPVYTTAVESLGLSDFSTWARLVRRALAVDVAEAAGSVGEQPALALRQAPPPLGHPEDPTELLDAIVTPVRSGFILTRQRLATAAATIGVGYRLGERRFALRAMLEQDPVATLSWLGRESRQWASSHEKAADAAGRWWAGRAARTGSSLVHLVGTHRS